MNHKITDTPSSVSWGEVWTLAWPLIIANGFWIIQTTVDRVFLAQHSTHSLAAATAVSGVFWAPMALVQQTAGYSITFVAQYFGAKKFAQVGASLWQSFYISIIGGLLFLLLIPFASQIFSFFDHPETLLRLESTYFISLCYTAIPFSILGAMGGFLAGIGKSHLILPINFAGVISNVVLDYLLIFGHFGFPALGIAGAGFATGIANVIACIVSAIIIFNSQHEALYKVKSAWRPNLDLLKRYVIYGVPSGLQYALEGFAFSVFLILIGRMPNGSVGLAGSGIAVSIMMLAIMPSVGVAQAVSVLVGQFIGKGQPQQAEKASHTGFKMALLYILTMSLTFLFFPEFYLSWFQNKENPALWADVERVTPYLLYFVAFFIPFDALNVIYAFALKGAGDTRFVTAVALLVPWPIMVFPTYMILNNPQALYWAWLTASLFLVAQGLIFLWRFKGGKWKSMKVIE